MYIFGTIEVLLRVKKIDPTVKKETLYIAAICFLLSVIMQSVFLILGFWNYTVLLGNILGYLAAVANFFLLGLSVQFAIKKEEENERKNLLKLSQILRFILLIIIAVVGYLVPIFNIIAVLIPYLFPRIAIALRPALIKK